MPFKEVCKMKERSRFVLKALEPNKNLSELCKEFGISRPTGYKWLKRYEQEGFEGLKELSRRPKRSPFLTSAEVVCEIVKHRDTYRGWSGKKIRPLLLKSFKLKDVPSSRTIDRILERCGLTKKRRRKSRKTYSKSSSVVTAEHSNHVWTVDFKGWWFTKDNIRCEPLTIRDERSRFIIGIYALRETRTENVIACFRECFEKYGLPEYIRSDNGSPFACSASIHGLSRLSAWWIGLGITPDRTQPGSPQENGGHERMHRDLKRELQSKPAKNLAEEQERFDQWRTTFNYERVHEGLGLITPAQYYSESTTVYDPDEPKFKYPKHFQTRRVGMSGRFSWFGRKLFLSKALDGLDIGIEQISKKEYRIWYAEFVIGTYDAEFSPLKCANLKR